MLFIYIGLVTLTNFSLTSCRTWFHEANEKKESCELLMKHTETATENNAAVFMGYKGAGLMMWSSHIKGALNKLSTFNKGKAWLEKAIKKNSQSLELRYLRFCFQSTVPDILQYSAERNNDKAFILKHTPTTTDAVLKAHIKKFMLENNHVTSDEKKSIRQQWNR